jgi:hypothetical protein
LAQQLLPQGLIDAGGDISMLRVFNIIALALVAVTAWGPSLAAAAADCTIISATHSADTKGEALLTSQALAAKGAKQLSVKRGWKHFSMSAQKVAPDPFWKKVRPKVPTDVIYASFVTPKTYSICFTGVVVPFVCTSGSKVCGK